MNADGSGLRTLTTALDSNPVWSPDGLRIAFTRRGANYNDDIHVMNADGSRPRNLTPGAGDEWPPVWSPDGQRIAFVRNVGGKGDVYVMNADGSGQRKLARGWAPTWSPDGRTIAFACAHRPLHHGCRRHRQRSLTQNAADDIFPVWSPDARRVAFVRQIGGKGRRVRHERRRQRAEAAHAECRAGLHAHLVARRSQDRVPEQPRPQRDRRSMS